MIKYAILPHPGHNRVYFETAKALSPAELEMSLPAMSVTCGNVEATDISGVQYITFDSDSELPDEDLRVLAGLSFIYALFERRGVCLYPVRAERPSFFDDDLSSLLKYSGKTNEIFTRLLINTAVCAGEFQKKADIEILDPVCGKGTTLFEAARLGYRAYGIEVSPDAVHDGAVYFKKYLETKRLKHTYQKRRHSGDNKSFMAEIHSFDTALNKAGQKAGETLGLEFVACDSRHADKIYKKEAFHIIVGDLPYGVKHGNISGKKQTSVTRNPIELLCACLPSWVRCLKKGGVIALSWNTFVLSRDDIAQIMTDNGLTVLNDSPYNRLSHRVDQAINRDIIAGRK